MAPADLEIVEVMGRGDLDRAGALLRIGVFVRDDGNAAADQRQHTVLADELLVTVIIGMHCNGSVAEHGLGPRSRDGQRTGPARPSTGYLKCQSCPFVSRCSTSRSEIAVSSFGSQLTRRLSL